MASVTGPDQTIALDFHGDAEVAPGLIDLAVNVRASPLPSWLSEPLAAAIADLSHYPDQTAARAALADRHGRTPRGVLPTAGAAQAFMLLAHAGRELRRPVVVHPQFTEPEAALRAVGVPVERVILTEETGFTLDPDRIPADADLIVIGNPTNPTSVLHSADMLAALARPGRLLVIDEAFADTDPGEPESLSHRTDLPGLVVIRSLTKTWALAGLRIGYVLAEPETVSWLAAHQPLWPVSTPALAAAVACASPVAVAAEAQIATTLRAHREHLLTRLAVLPAVRVAGVPRSSFVALHVPDGVTVRAGLRAAGFAVRRGDTFPGLGPNWLRVAVREPPVSDTFAEALAGLIKE
jgi:histidinol-phosphate aminotransferase